MGTIAINTTESTQDSNFSVKINIDLRKAVKCQLKQLLNWSLADIRQIYVPYRKRKSSPLLNRSEFQRFIRMSQRTSFYIYDNLIKNKQPLIVFEVVALLILASYTSISYKIQFMFYVFDLRSRKSLEFSELILLFKSLMRGYSFLTNQQTPSNDMLQKYARTMFSKADINNDQSLELPEILNCFLGNDEAKQFFEQFSPIFNGKQQYYILNSFTSYRQTEVKVLFERIEKVYHKQKITELDFSMLKQKIELSQQKIHQESHPKPFLSIRSQQGSILKQLPQINFVQKKTNTLQNVKKQESKVKNICTTMRAVKDQNVNEIIKINSNKFNLKHKIQNIIIIKGRTITKKEVFEIRQYFDRITNGKKDMYIEDFIESFNQENYNHMKSVAASLYNFLDKNQAGKVCFVDLIQKLYPNLATKHIKIIMKWIDDYDRVFNLQNKIKDTRNKEDLRKRSLPRSCLPRFKQIFNVFDRQKKGFITFQNMKTVLGDVCNNRELIDLFEQSDQNKDGKLTLQQFVHVLLPPDLDIEGLR